MQNPTIALAAAIAAVRGGLRCVEVAMTTPHATRIMRDLAAACPDAVVGAGTVLTHMQVRQACDAGAKFALSPVTDADIIAECHRSGMLAVPGAATPTECFRAYEMGARVVKVFPINLYGGIAFVKAMQGPLPQIPLLATSGIDTESLSQYLSAPNVLAVGASRQILPKEALENKDWTGVTRRARVWARIAEQYVADCDALSPSSRPGSTHSDTVT